jgi:hypothetical protein
MHHFIISALVCLGLFRATGAEVSKEASQAAPPQSFIIGISPFLDKGVKDDVYRSIIKLIVEELPLNSTLAIYDAFDLKTVTQVSLPNAHVFSSPKTRANQFAPAIRDLKVFLAQTHVAPTNSKLHFEQSIRVPQFLDFLTENLRSTDAPPAVLLIGSPLYQDAKEPGFSMIDGFFPSDGHLHATHDKSVFGFSGNPEEARPLMMYWTYFGDPWVSDLHKENVTRFWTLYLERRAGQLAAFTSDFPTALQSFRQIVPVNKSGSKKWTLTKGPGKIEMLRTSRNVEIADWLTRDTIADPGQNPPSVMVGPMKIGIRWKANIDLDLYSIPRPGAETLFFQHPRSPEGYYNKDHRSSPGREYEFIEYDTQVDIREVEAYVNFYKGSCPGGPQGEVRIEFDGKIFGAPFSLRASEGNLGEPGRSQSAYWTRIPVQEMLRLPPPASRGG